MSFDLVSYCLPAAGLLHCEKKKKEKEEGRGMDGGQKSVQEEWQLLVCAEQ